MRINQEFSKMNTRTFSHKIGLISLGILSTLGTGCASTSIVPSTPVAPAKIVLPADETVVSYDGFIKERTLHPDIVTRASRNSVHVGNESVVSYDVPGYARGTLSFASR